MDARLYALKKTLNDIEVHGSENLDMLLGCIHTIDKMIQEARANEQQQDSAE